MPPRKINTRNSFLRKKDLFDALGLVSLAMRPCRNCAMSSKACCVNDDFEKCVECVRSSRGCDLAISSTSIKRIYEERMRLKKEVREARAKLSRLKKQLDFLENKEEEMIVTKWKNIDDLKMNEAHFTKFVAKTLELLFDVSFEQFQLSIDWNWATAFLPSFDRTSLEGFDND